MYCKCETYCTYRYILHMYSYIPVETGDTSEGCFCGTLCETGETVLSSVSGAGAPFITTLAVSAAACSPVSSAALDLTVDSNWSLCPLIMSCSGVKPLLRNISRCQFWRWLFLGICRCTGTLEHLVWFSEIWICLNFFTAHFKLM